MHAEFPHLRHAELLAEAAAHRRHRPRTPRPSRVLRLYARLWWASRPRAAAWVPTLLDGPA